MLEQEVPATSEFQTSRVARFTLDSLRLNPVHCVVKGAQRVRDMRRIYLVALILSLAVAVLVWDFGVASAQVTGNSADVLSGILVRALQTVRGVLGYFVAGNVLAQPAGGDAVNSLATIAQTVVTWFAQFSSLLSGGSPG
jgi:hypothetical protein